MTINGTLAETVKSAISSNSGFNDVIVVMAYENEIKPTPIEKPIIAISVKSCEIGNKLDKVLDSGLTVETDDREVLTTISADIYLPYSKSGNDGHKIFDRIATFLLYTKKYNITKSTCSKADYDNNCEALILRAQFTFRNVVSA